MSFNRRGPDRRPDRPDRSDRDRHDRPPQRRASGDWEPRGPRERAPGERPHYPPRDRGGGGRPYSARPPFDRGQDDGGMSLRLDPRRLSALKRLASEAGVRPGDLVRAWVEQRIDAERSGAPTGPEAASLRGIVEALESRVAALEAAASPGPATHRAAPRESGVSDAGASPQPTLHDDTGGDARPQPATEPAPKRVSAAPPGGRVALHDEMIEVLRERGPLSAGELAEAITERGRYVPPRSGKALDAATISQRVSNPTYRSRFTRAEGRIGLAGQP